MSNDCRYAYNILSNLIHTIRHIKYKKNNNTSTTFIAEHLVLGIYIIDSRYLKLTAMFKGIY